MTDAFASPRPPRSLSAESRALWERVQREYTLDDAAGLALLRQLCETLDRLRSVQRQIAKDGLMVASGSKGQTRPHPLLSVEAECRRSMLALVRALKLDVTAETL